MIKIVFMTNELFIKHFQLINEKNGTTVYEKTSLSILGYI